MIALICEKKEQERLKMLLSEFGDVEIFKDGMVFAGLRWLPRTVPKVAGCQRCFSRNGKADFGEGG